MSVRMPVSLSVCLPVCLYVCRSVCLLVRLNSENSATIKTKDTKIGMKDSVYHQFIKIVFIIRCHAHFNHKSINKFFNSIWKQHIKDTTFWLQHKLSWLYYPTLPSNLNPIGQYWSYSSHLSGHNNLVVLLLLLFLSLPI